VAEGVSLGERPRVSGPRCSRYQGFRLAALNSTPGYTRSPLRGVFKTRLTHRDQQDQIPLPFNPKTGQTYRKGDIDAIGDKGTVVANISVRV
jgi:hypothetical protein